MQPCISDCHLFNRSQLKTKGERWISNLFWRVTHSIVDTWWSWQGYLYRHLLHTKGSRRGMEGLHHRGPAEDAGERILLRSSQRVVRPEHHWIELFLRLQFLGLFLSIVRASRRGNPRPCFHRQESVHRTTATTTRRRHTTKLRVGQQMLLPNEFPASECRLFAPGFTLADQKEALDGCGATAMDLER